MTPHRLWEALHKASAPEQGGGRSPGGGPVEPEGPRPLLRVWLYYRGCRGDTWPPVRGPRDACSKSRRRGRSPHGRSGTTCPLHPSPPSMLHTRCGFLKPPSVGALAPLPPGGKAASLLKAGVQGSCPSLCARRPGHHLLHTGPVSLTLFILRTFTLLHIVLYGLHLVCICHLEN